MPFKSMLQRADGPRAGTKVPASLTTLEALARALQLDEAERAHLFDVARAASPRHDPPSPRPEGGPSGVQEALNAITDARRSCATAAWTSWPPTSRPTPCSRRCTSTRHTRPTAPVHLLQPRRKTSTRTGTGPSARTGTGPRTTSWPFCAPTPPRPLRPRAVGPRLGACHAPRGIPNPVAAHNVRQHHTGLKHFHHPWWATCTFRTSRWTCRRHRLSLLMYNAQPGSSTDDAPRVPAGFAAANHVETAPAATAPAEMTLAVDGERAAVRFRTCPLRRDAPTYTDMGMAAPPSLGSSTRPAGQGRNGARYATTAQTMPSTGSRTNDSWLATQGSVETSNRTRSTPLAGLVQIFARSIGSQTRVGGVMCAISAADVHVVRRVYAALETGDMNELEQCFARDAVWHEPGDNIYSGDRQGWPEIRDDFLSLLGPLSRGAFRAELVDIAVGQEYVVAVHRGRGEHNGRILDSLSFQVVRVVRGRIQEVWSNYANQAEVDAFWT